MVDYDVLLMIIGHLQMVCAHVWQEPTLPWPAVFIADFVQGDISMDQFRQMMSLAGQPYADLAKCIVEVR